MAEAPVECVVGHAAAARLAAWLESHSRVAVVTGAGVSTHSGIPDYRDAQGRWKRPAPIQHSDFVRHARTRQRYWARSFIGWPHFAAAQPNAAHRVLAALGRGGRIAEVITQNVDGLHERAGARHVIDLHGRLDRVACLDCGAVESREVYQQRLTLANPGWTTRGAHVAPDGDADLQDADYTAFAVPACARCGGVMKPAVVFYGGRLDDTTRAAAHAAVTAADGVLVVGSSLIVWSAYSLVQAAAGRGIPIVAVNHGRTRADPVLDFKCDGECGQLLAVAAAGLGIRTE
ncbi:MAG TPA: NAD-dependent protein deacetylase [Nevskiaceae bacterium]|nr:NAD-dependent protein deacetylase [Nevskiaceae bacterium]